MGSNIDVNKGLNLAPANKGLEKAIKNIEKLNEATIAYNKSLQTGLDVAGAGAKAAKAKKEADSELLKLRKQNIKVLEQYKAATSAENKLLQDNRVKLQARNKAIRENSKAQLEAIQSIKKAERAYKDEARTIAQATKQNKALRVAIRNVDATTTKGAATIAKYNKKIDANTKFIQKNSDSYVKQKMNIGNYASALNGLPGPLGRVGGAIQTVGQIMKVAMANPIFLIIGLVAGLVAAIGSAVKVAKEFQSANADLAATLGVTRKETAALQKEAKKLGATTAFTAMEVTNLQNEYAKLGFSQKEILGLTESTIDLSVATRKGADETAAFVGALVRSFGLSASEATRVADVTAKAAASSALDFDKLSVALPIVGTTAKTAGDDLEGVTAKLGILADRGIDASTSGTALRNIYLQLSKQGLTYDQALAKINNSTDKNATALKLFGTRGATVGVVLAETTAEVAKLDDTLRNAGGTAARVAAEKLNTLEGKTTLMKSAWEGLKLSIADGEGVFVKMAEGAVEGLTHIIRYFTFLVKVTGAVWQTIYALHVNFVAAVVGIIKRIKEWALSFKWVADAVTWVGEAFSGFKKMAAEAFDFVQTKAEEFVNGLIRRLNKLPFFGDLKEIVFKVKEDSENTKLGKRAEESAKKAKDKWAEVFDFYRTEVKEINDIPIAPVAANTGSIGSKGGEAGTSKKVSTAAIDKAVEAEDAEFLRIAEMELEADQKVIDSSLNKTKIIADAHRKAADDIINKEIEKNELLKQMDEEAKERYKLNVEDQIAALAVQDQSILSTYSNLEQIATDVFNNITEAQIGAIDSQLQALDQKRDAEGNLRKEDEQEYKRLEREKAKIRRKQAAVEKATAIAGIIISTAQAIMSMMKLGPLGIPLAALAGVAGAAQLANVIAQPLPPIPQFYKGTENAPSGLAWVGERGPEAIESNGMAFLTPGVPTLANLAGGERILTAEQTAAKYGSNAGLEERLDTLIAKPVPQLFISPKVIQAVTHKNGVSTYVNRRLKDA